MAGDKPWTSFARAGAAGLLPAGSRQTGHDLIAALALAAVAIPEQMATARLAGAPAALGLLVFVAASLGFFLLGSSRFLSVGADTTIAPIFAGTLAVLAVPGSSHYLSLAAALALLVGAIVAVGGVFRLGWIARLLSIPVITGFLAGISIHIAVSQLPELLGFANAHDGLLSTLESLGRSIAHLNSVTLLIGIAVFVITFICEKVDIRLPGALIAMVLVSLAVSLSGKAGIAVIGAIQFAGVKAAVPNVSFSDVIALAPLALMVSLVISIQTAVTTRSFQDDPAVLDINRDLIGVGLANIFGGIFGGFPANASPPRTAIVAESGGVSRLSGLFAAVIVATFFFFGLDLLATVPVAALAGLLLFVAQRLFRLGTIRSIATQSRGEFVLLLVTAAAIVVTPIEMGVGIGIALSVLHGVWTITQTRTVRFGQVPGSTVWWPSNPHFAGQTIPGIVVAGFQAPLFFLNAETFRKTLNEVILGAPQPVHAIILEASSIVEIDFSGAQTLLSLIRFWKDRGVNLYIARLESVRAQEAAERFGILDLLGKQQSFHSVDDAIKYVNSRGSKGDD